MFGFVGNREFVYPLSIKGKFQTIRIWTFVGLHVVLFLTPWITVGGHPLLRIDLAARTTYFAGMIFTASDIILLLLVLLFLAFALFFFTSLLGRVWCGYACPQTVFLESWIRPVETWIEGSRGARRRREEAGLSFDLVWRKALKWSVFLLVSLLLSMSMMSFFAGARELWTLQAGKVEYTLVAIGTALWFWDFAWFREQFCNYLCPYARFQGALTDDESLVIMYDEARGEPRGGKEAREHGYCVDCNKCVAVCPQGIDIRDGFQLECIACARCIDACETVMPRFGYKNLIGYGSEAGQIGGKIRWLRPRTGVYAALLLSLVFAGGALVAGRVPFEASVNRAPGSLFTVDTDGYIRNTYLLKITNKDAAADPQTFGISVLGLDSADVLARDVTLSSTESLTVPLVIRVPPSQVNERTIPIRVRVTRVAGGDLILNTTFKTGAEVAYAN